MIERKSELVSPIGGGGGRRARVEGLAEDRVDTGERFDMRRAPRTHACGSRNIF